MPKCPECGALYGTGDEFCPECGERIKPQPIKKAPAHEAVKIVVQQAQPKKHGFLISLLIITFLSASTSIFLKSQTQDIGLTEPGMEMASSMLRNFIRGGWIIAVIAGFISLLLIISALRDYFKKKSAEKE